MRAIDLYGPGSFPAVLHREDGPTPKCRGAKDSLFFPPTGRPSGPARRICHRCPLFFACTAWALSRPPHELHGVWGGLSQNDRLAILGRPR